MIDLEARNIFSKRVGDTPTDALQLTPRKYVDKNNISVAGQPSLMGAVIFAASSNLGVVQSGQTITYFQSVLGASVADIQVFNSSGTWVKPVGAKEVFVEGWGAGGGSGGCTANNQSPGAGGGGYMYRWVPSSILGSNEPVIVGIGGGAGIAGASPGFDGGYSSFGSSVLTANGGLAGPAQGSTTVGGGGGGTGQNVFIGQTGALSYVGLVQDYGGGGGGGVIATAAQIGGNTIFGAAGGGAGSTGGGSGAIGGTSLYEGGLGGAGGGNAVGTGGTQPGGGAGGSGSTGGGSSRTGAAGGDGRIRVTTFF